jgi:hypothetical protein
MHRYDICSNIIDMTLEDMMKTRENLEKIRNYVEAVVEKTGEGFRVIKVVRAPDGGIRLVLEAE